MGVDGSSREVEEISKIRIVGKLASNEEKNGSGSH